MSIFLFYNVNCSKKDQNNECKANLGKMLTIVFPGLLLSKRFYHKLK